MRKNSMPSPSRFLSTPSARRATLTDVLSMTVSMIFLSTPSARRATQTNTTYEFTKSDFYPRPPRGGRPAGCLADLFPAGFLSTPSARRATSRRLCAGTGQAISIHALREEGDDFFSFLCYSCTDFYPRPPRGGRLSAERTSVTSIPISIHALREEGDPVGVAAVRQQIISIHALREEGDAAGTDGAQDQKHFYPRPPRGGRHISLVYPQKTALFLSTPSARRATPHSGRPSSQPADFYPRPPRGGRLKASVTLYTLPNFYPRPPRGGRLY